MRSKPKQTHSSGPRTVIAFSETIAYLLGMRYASYAMARRDADYNTVLDRNFPSIEENTNIPSTSLERPMCDQKCMDGSLEKLRGPIDH